MFALDDGAATASCDDVRPDRTAVAAIGRKRRLEPLHDDFGRECVSAALADVASATRVGVQLL